MMNSIILCEGMTDAILLSYYLGHTCDWKFTDREKDKFVKIPIRNAENEGIYWYKRDTDRLAIWGIGGKDNFEYAILELTKINQLLDKEKAFSKIVLLHDRDDAVTDQPILDTFTSYFSQKIPVELQNNTWSNGELTNDFDEKIPVQILPLIIPFDKKGALETFLLDAIAEEVEEGHIVGLSREFIAAIKSEKYLTRERLRLKAELGVTFAIISPDKVFTPLDQMLQQIPWEKYKAVHTHFAHLDEI